MAERPPRSASLGQWIAGVGAVVLIASLWTNWYGPELSFEGEGRNLPEILRPLIGSVRAGIERLTEGQVGNAWEVFSGADVALFLLGLAAAVLTAVAIGFAGPRKRSDQHTIGRVTMLLGIAALAIVIIKLIDQPDPAVLIEVTHGAWIGLGGAIAMTVGGWLATQ